MYLSQCCCALSLLLVVFVVVLFSISNFISILMLSHFQWKCSFVVDGCRLVRKFLFIRKNIFSEDKWKWTWFWLSFVGILWQQGIDIRYRCCVGITTRCSRSVDWCCYFCISSTASRQLRKYFRIENIDLNFLIEMNRCEHGHCKCFRPILIQSTISLAL